MKFYSNLNIFIQEKAIKIVVCIMAAILFITLVLVASTNQYRQPAGWAAADEISWDGGKYIYWVKKH